MRYHAFNLLQASRNDDKGAAMFTMHGLVHDNRRWSKEIHILPMHYNLVTSCRGKLEDHHVYYGIRALRCINCSNMVFHDRLFQRSLRVLELKGSPAPELPGSIRKLRYLGYLKISEFTGLATLPESFGDLTYLFHIDLSGCSVLAALPESFGELTYLSHVNLSRCHALTKFPEQLWKLDKLVHLDYHSGLALKGSGKALVASPIWSISTCQTLAAILLNSAPISKG
jgi:hypothetical protein